MSFPGSPAVSFAGMYVSPGIEVGSWSPAGESGLAESVTMDNGLEGECPKGDSDGDW